MKKIITLFTAITMVAILSAQSAYKIILVNAPMNDQTRIALRELYGSGLKMQLASTNELVLNVNASAAEVRQALSAKIGTVQTREVTQAEFDKLVGDQLSPKTTTAPANNNSNQTRGNVAPAGATSTPAATPTKYADQDRLAAERAGKNQTEAPKAKPENAEKKENAKPQKTTTNKPYERKGN